MNSNLNSSANSSVSIYDDYRFASQSEHGGTASPVRYSRLPHLPETSSSDHMELNFASKPEGQKMRLRDRIKTKLRENRKEKLNFSGYFVDYFSGIAQLVKFV